MDQPSPSYETALDMHNLTLATAKQYHEANAKIIAIFEHLEQVVDSIDQHHEHSKSLRNPKDLFPIAAKIVKTVSDSTHVIHEAYVDYIQNDESEAHVISVIETEAWKIFKAIKTVIMEARRLDIDPITNNLLHSAKPYYEDAQMRRGMTQPDRKALEKHSALYTKRGPVQTALIEEARRLGPEYGSGFLLAIDDTFLALLTMLQAVKAVGINLDLNQLPGIETNPEHWLEPAMELDMGRKKETDIDTSVRHLAIMMQMCREDASRLWATRRIH